MSVAVEIAGSRQTVIRAILKEQVDGASGT